MSNILNEQIADLIRRTLSPKGLFESLLKIKGVNVIIKSVAREFSICGYDPEDKEQVCLLALYRACETFDESKGVLFKTFAKTIMRNALTDLHRKDNNCGAIPRSAVLSIDVKLSEGDDVTLGDVLPCDTLADSLAMSEVEWAGLLGQVVDCADEAYDRMADGEIANNQIKSCYFAFLAYLVDQGLITTGIRQDLIDLIKPDDGILVLFKMAPERNSPEGAELLSSLAEQFGGFISRVAELLADGHRISGGSLAEALGIAPTALNRIIRAIGVIVPAEEAELLAA